MEILRDCFSNQIKNANGGVPGTLLDHGSLWSCFWADGSFFAPQIESMQGSWVLPPAPHLASTYSLVFEHRFWNSAAWVQIQVLELTEDGYWTWTWTGLEHLWDLVAWCMRVKGNTDFIWLLWRLGKIIIIIIIMHMKHPQSGWHATNPH